MRNRMFDIYITKPKQETNTSSKIILSKETLNKIKENKKSKITFTKVL